MSLASTLPSSTPHWSKLLMPQSAPLVNTRCSYSAISAPSAARRQLLAAAKKVLGRLPGKCAVAACASRLAQHQRLRLRQAVGQQLGVVARQRSCAASLHGDELHRHHVGALVQHLEVGMLAVGAGLAPQHRARCRRAAAAPSTSTRLPLLSISSCCR